MSTASSTGPASAGSREEEAQGLRRLGTGAGAGLAAGILTVVLPVAFLWLAAYNPGGFFTYGTSLLDATALFILAGAILFVVSLFLYRRGFAVLRKVDSHFAVASVLCIVGSIGFLLLLVAAVVLVGSSNPVLNCIHGAPSHALSCLKSGEPLGAYTGLAGFWLGWLGGVGIVVGIALVGRRYLSGTVSGGAALYSILLLVLLGPFLALLTPLPGLQYLLLAAPLLAVLAPGLVLGGTRRSLATLSSSA